MDELNTEKLINQTNDDEIACMLLNIENFKDMADYTEYTDSIKEDLEYELEFGFILDITPGTYTGALDKTDYSELTTENIYSALLEETHEYLFQYLLKCDGENDASEARRVRLVTEFYKVFTIGQRLYIDYD